MNNYVREFDATNGRLPAEGTQRRTRNIVEFFSHQIKDDDASDKAGRPIYREITMIRIMQPGDKNHIVERKARAHDKIEYAQQWAAFERAEQIADDGTPLEHWSLLDRTVCRELKFFNVATIEQLAGLNDGQIAQIGMLGLRTLVRQAKAFLETAKTGQVPVALVSENEQLKAEVERLKKQLADASLRFETELRKAGANPANVSGVEAPGAVAEPKALAPTQTNALAIPDDLARMSNKELFDLARRATGFSFKTRSEAEEALREMKSA